MSFSAPQPAVARIEDAGANAVGVDRGVRHTIATSDGFLSNIPEPTRKETLNLKKNKQRLSRQQPGSRRYQQTKRAIAKTLACWADRRKDWVELTSTRLVEANSVVVFEALTVEGMMASAVGTVENPGVNVAAKRGLNRGIAGSCWTMLARRTVEKAEASGTVAVFVNAAYTSQRCSECSHTHRHNRRGDAFRCLGCGHEDHTDINAANNILAAGLAVVRRGGNLSGSQTRQVGTTKRRPHREAA